MDKSNMKHFDMTLEECRRVLDTIDGLVVVDRKGILKYLCPDMFPVLERLYGTKLPQNVTGMHISEIHPTSKISKGLMQENPMEDYFYLSEGVINAARIKAVYHGEAVSGAIDYDLFTDNWQLSNFMERAEKMLKGTTARTMKAFNGISDYYGKKRQSKNLVADIIGESPGMIKLKQKIYDLVESDSTVLVTGETGTGKEVVAQAVHGTSMRGRFPMVEVNCASIPENLFESELFGYEEGSFTGANRGGRQGRFQMADKGTIFLDEIDQIPYHVQPKLLRVLQEKEVVTIGGKKINIDIRIIAATNKNLKKLVAEGLFREDLYYRLNVINIEIPPLRERKNDVLLLAKEHIHQLNSVLNCVVDGITDDAAALLMEYHWPGNVRELFNMVERAMNECKTNFLDRSHFKELDIERLRGVTVGNAAESDSNLLEKIMSDTEKKTIEKALRMNQGNITAAAKLLGITRPCLHYKLKKHEIKNQHSKE